MRWLLVFLATIVLVSAFSVYSVSHRPPVQAQGTPVATSTDISLGEPVVYRSEKNNFTITHPERTETKTENFEGYLPKTQMSEIGFLLPSDAFEGTNLGEAGVFVGVTATPAIVANCTATSTGMGEIQTGTAKFNGADWSVFTAHDAAAGNIYEEKTFRTVHDKKCYEIVELLHSGNIGNYPEGAVKEFDHAKFKSILESVAQSFTFTP